MRYIIVLMVLIIVNQLFLYTCEKNEERIDCYPETESNFSNYSKENCLKRNCFYDENAKQGSIQCYLNKNSGYILQDINQTTNNTLQIRLKRNEKVESMFPKPIDNVLLTVQYYTNDIIRLTFSDQDHQRYQVPIPLNSPLEDVSSPQYQFNSTSDSEHDNIFSFKISRIESNCTLFDTSLGGLVLNDQYLQIITRLQSSHIYGFGENNHDTLKHNLTEEKSWGIFARDQGTNWDTNANNYGQHPFYIVMEQISSNDSNPSGSMHGVLLLNSNAMDYSFKKSQSLTIRTIGGILDFFLFLGPKPEQVIQQYTWLIGRSILPPYWALGFQLSRWDYSNLTYMKTVVQRNIDAGIPLDVQYADIDYMDKQKVFTIDQINYKGIKQYFKELNQYGIRTIIILDPGFLDDQLYYQPTIDAIQQNVFIKWDYTKTPIKGACWPGEVFYPDFFTNRTQKWWDKWIKDFYHVNLTFDGLWIDMNEPALFETNDEIPWNWMDTGSNYTLKCPLSDYDDPPYRTKAVFRYDSKINRTGRLSDRTLCMSAHQGENDPQTNLPIYRHYDVHSLYGWSQTKPTLDTIQSLTGKRGLVLPRSTFVGSGQWSGHWLGDNEATWHEMKRSIIGMIEFNWFGIPFNGADICGFDKTPSEEMCIRWMQLGAFYPFSRNHNIWKTADQDPASWSQSAVEIMRKALEIRYFLLPYYYTLFFKAHTEGSTVIRPLFHQYPNDRNTLDIYLQFLIGSSVMISPVTDDQQRQVEVYIPSSHWFDYYTGKQILAEKEFVTLDAPLDTIPILLRGGSILPTQDYANNTKYSREKPFGLLIVLDKNGNAHGDLFSDDGESIDTIKNKEYYYALFEYSSTSNQLTINIIQNNYSHMSNLTLDSLVIYGLNSIPLYWNINQKIFYPKIRLNSQIIEIKGLNLSMSDNHTISWNNSQLILVETPQIVYTEPKYRVNCHPDQDATSLKCLSRGCQWEPITESDFPYCYVPKEKGGYTLQKTSSLFLNDMITFNLTRLSKKPENILLRPLSRYSRYRNRQEQHFHSTVEQLVSTTRKEFSIFGHDIDQLNVQITYSGKNMIRMQIRDPFNERYEVPVPIKWKATPLSQLNEANIQFELTKNSYGQVGFRLERRNPRSILFDTSFFANGFIYDDRYIQIMTTIPSRNIYGFGENTHSTFQHLLNNSHRYGIFARDQPPLGKDENLYGTHPFYMVIENNGMTFAVFILNSNAQDYKLDLFENNQSMLTYRTIGGILDIILFAGPTPEDVIKQYQSVIGYPYMPPYWALGFQLCRYGYDTLQNMKAAMQRTLDGKIPLDVMYGDIDYFRNQLDFTWDPIRFKGLPEYIDWLHEHGMKFITILDPAIDAEENNYPTYLEGLKDDIYIKWPQHKNLQVNLTGNRNMLGYVWPIGRAVFPDFFSSSTKQWWKNQILNYYQKIKFDGLWIDMNEPANFDTNKLQPWNWPHPDPWNLHCPIDEPLEFPPYKTSIWGDHLSDKTICMIGEQTDEEGNIYHHYDLHNLYGWSETVATLPATRATENKRSIVISRSTFPTSGSMSGHWLGDNTAAWTHLKYNIIGMLEFNLFGIPYVGADICGFEGNTTEQLCQRWMQLGAFNPFFRNHNGIGFGDHDPGNFPPDIVDSNRRAVETRYRLNPYLYTLFHHVHISGGTVVRSMAHQYPTDSQSWSIDEQFLWGSHLLIAPVIHENHTNKSVYLPANDRWYDYYTGQQLNQLGHITVDAPLDSIPLFIRGGIILPHQHSAMNTVLARKKAMYLIIALDNQQKAQGNLFWDDGDSIDTYQNSFYNYLIFNYNKQNLTIEPILFKYKQMTQHIQLQQIQIFGFNNKPKNITLNGESIYDNNDTIIYNDTLNTLNINQLSLDLDKTHQFNFY